MAQVTVELPIIEREKNGEGAGWVEEKENRDPELSFRHVQFCVFGQQKGDVQ